MPTAEPHGETPRELLTTGACGHTEQRLRAWRSRRRQALAPCGLEEEGAAEKQVPRAAPAWGGRRGAWTRGPPALRRLPSSLVHKIRDSGNGGVLCGALLLLLEYLLMSVSASGLRTGRTGRLWDRSLYGRVLKLKRPCFYYVGSLSSCLKK